MRVWCHSLALNLCSGTQPFLAAVVPRRRSLRNSEVGNYTENKSITHACAWSAAAMLIMFSQLRKRESTGRVINSAAGRKRHRLDTPRIRKAVQVMITSTSFILPHRARLLFIHIYGFCILYAFMPCLDPRLAKHAEPLAPSPAGHVRSAHISFGLEMERAECLAHFRLSVLKNRFS